MIWVTGSETFLGSGTNVGGSTKVRCVTSRAWIVAEPVQEPLMGSRGNMVGDQGENPPEDLDIYETCQHKNEVFDSLLII